MRFDPTGKVTLDRLYTQPDPRTYFGILRRLGYCVPQQAKPYFEKLIKEYREARQVTAPTVIDIGCSYGINAALLKCDATMDELYARYAGDSGPGHPGRTVGSAGPAGPAGPAARTDPDRQDTPAPDPEATRALLARDRELIRTRRPAQPLRFVGLDISADALSYALAAGFLDDAVHADLENHDPTPAQRAQLAGADLVISTGCLGYVTERTLTRVVRAQDGGRQPWMAHSVLRMFPFDAVESALAGFGYRTVRVGREIKQRRFASAEEQALVLDTMSSGGVDTRGLEAEGWLYAQLYLSRPAGPE